jgi:ParB family chromosome partitioning protein
VDARFCELEADIERLEAKRHAYYPDDIARGGAFVILNHDGTVRIERGFIRTEDEKPEPQAEHSADEPSSANVDVEGVDGRVEYADGAAGEDAADEEITTVRCRTSLFETSRHIVPWD